MTLDAKRLYRKKIFVDSNAFIYFFTGECSNVTKEIFKLAETGWLNLITTTRVLDEVFFKVMIISAKIRFGIDNKMIQKLRKDKEKTKLLAEDIEKVIEFIGILKPDIKEINYSALKKLQVIMETYGLFGNDAMILETMQRFNLKYLLSSDTDFDEIGWIERMEAIGKRTKEIEDIEYNLILTSIELLGRKER